MTTVPQPTTGAATKTAEPPLTIVGHVAELWRYPVKSLAGEALSIANLTANGFAGDRVVHVHNRETGHVITSRTHPRLLGLRGSLGADGEPLVNGLPWHSPEAAELVRQAAGPEAELLRFDGVERFDVLPVSLATDGAVAALGYDRRRLRPNILLGDVAGLTEREWVGRRLKLGEAEIEVFQVRPRCVMTTYDPDTLAQDHRVLRRIVKEFGGRMALDCSVIQAGRIAINDPAYLLDA